MISVTIDNLANSQLTYDLITHINSNKLNWPIYYRNISPSIMKVDGMIDNFSNLAGYNGKILCFELSTVQILSNVCNGNIDIYLYLYDLEWLYRPINYFDTISILRKTKLACRSDSHQKNIENFSDIKASICKEMKEVEQWITQN